MRVVKNILMAFGVLLLAIVAFWVWIASSSANFRKQQAPFITAFVSDLSRHWDIADVSSRSGDLFVQQARSPQGQQLFGHFRHLGALKSIGDLELRNYTHYSNGKSGVFVFNAIFEHGDAVVTLTVMINREGERVENIYLSGHRIDDQGQHPLQT